MNPHNPFTPPATAPYGASDAAAQDAQLTPQIVEHLKQTRPWVVFFAIFGLLGAALMVVGGITMLAMPSMPTEMKGFGALYMFAAVLYVFPSLFLLRYGDAIRRVMDGQGVPALEEALRQQKLFWRLVGIMALVMLVLMVVAFVFSVVATMI